MKPIEDRLRDAALAAARTVPDDGAPPLRLPAGRPGLRRALPRPRGRLLAVIAPVTAAAAVAGVLAGAVVAHRHDGTSVPPAGAVAAPRVPPPYLVARHYIGTFKKGQLLRTDAVIARTATGKALITVPVPRPYNSFVAITGAYNDRTFVLAAQQLTRRGPALPATQLYELRLAVAGRMASYTLTRMPGGLLPRDSFADMALSPDGTRLAVDEQWRQHNIARDGLRVYDLATGRFRSWTLAGGGGVYPVDEITSPSWDASGRFVALTVHSGRCPNCVRLLDTASHATTVGTASRIIVRPPRIPSRWLDWNSTMLSPDGRRVLRSVTICVAASGNGCRIVTRVYGYSARSGRQLVALRSPHDLENAIVWLNPGGTHFVFTTLASVRPPFIAAFGYTPGGFLVRVPLPPQTVDVTW